MSAVTLNRYCASGLSATNFAALQALHGDTLAVGGGIEMMSRLKRCGQSLLRPRRRAAGGGGCFVSPSSQSATTK